MLDARATLGEGPVRDPHKGVSHRGAATRFRLDPDGTPGMCGQGMCGQGMCGQGMCDQSPEARAG